MIKIEIDISKKIIVQLKEVQRRSNWEKATCKTSWYVLNMNRDQVRLNSFSYRALTIKMMVDFKIFSKNCVLKFVIIYTIDWFKYLVKFLGLQFSAISLNLCNVFVQLFYIESSLSSWFLFCWTSSCWSSLIWPSCSCIFLWWHVAKLDRRLFDRRPDDTQMITSSKYEHMETRKITDRLLLKLVRREHRLECGSIIKE